ncbi:MAG: hypothetical protein P4M14_02885 [Gammaproteobacteria bacterium]|nr:hypothetical protein [Gammaproteobacteria bacterium]
MIKYTLSAMPSQPSVFSLDIEVSMAATANDETVFEEIALLISQDSAIQAMTLVAIPAHSAEKLFEIISRHPAHSLKAIKLISPCLDLLQSLPQRLTQLKIGAVVIENIAQLGAKLFANPPFVWNLRALGMIGLSLEKTISITPILTRLPIKVVCLTQFAVEPTDIVLAAISGSSVSTLVLDDVDSETMLNVMMALPAEVKTLFVCNVKDEVLRLLRQWLHLIGDQVTVLCPPPLDKKWAQLLEEGIPYSSSSLVSQDDLPLTKMARAFKPGCENAMFDPVEEKDQLSSSSQSVSDALKDDCVARIDSMNDVVAPDRLEDLSLEAVSSPLISRCAAWDVSPDYFSTSHTLFSFSDTQRSAMPASMELSEQNQSDNYRCQSFSS